MDLFKKNNVNESTSLDFYVKVVKQNTKERPKVKKMLHQISRARIKHQIKKEIKNLMED